jgi:hypothetical protein
MSKGDQSLVSDGDEAFEAPPPYEVHSTGELLASSAAINRTIHFLLGPLFLADLEKAMVPLIYLFRHTRQRNYRSFCFHHQLNIHL